MSRELLYQEEDIDGIPACMVRRVEEISFRSSDRALIAIREDVTMEYFLEKNRFLVYSR